MRFLSSGFVGSADRFGERLALEVGGEKVTYQDLRSRAAALAATLQQQAGVRDIPLTAVFGSRSVTAFSGILGALLRGHGYVPLNPTFPIERTREMLVRSGCREIIVDRGCVRHLAALLEGTKSPLVIVLPDADVDITSLRATHPTHQFLTGADLAPADAWRPVEPSEDSVAYLLFTSGSTGVPKGVMVTHRNVRHYIQYIVERHGFTEADRFSQTFEHTFDLSVADMFVAWECGGCVCCPSRADLIKPGQFINKSQLTVWFSVPSLAVFMKRLGELKPAAYPKLRVSMFCGEALPVEVAKSWAAAAPNSVVENLYGPTELTIACTLHRWQGESSERQAEQGCVPIGDPFPGMEVRVVDDELKAVAEGMDGELVMTGPQLSPGYWRDAERTARSFVRLPGEDSVFYRTGDRVRRAKKESPLVYLGRMDNQIKITGHRVELGEIEAVARRESGLDGVVAVGWPLNPGGADGVELFLETESLDVAALQNRMAARLPAYMVPRRIHLVPRLPLNSNGKYDRKALLGRLAESK
jgi:amino acid adenylation domain-containing protein